MTGETARARAEGLVETTHVDDVAVVRLRRPPHNLLTVPMLAKLADDLEALADSGCRAAVLAADGRSFCAGADFRSGSGPNPVEAAGFADVTRRFYEHATRIFECHVPIVAAIDGAAIGAGLGIALASDIRVVGADGWFQANFVKLGIHPGFAISVTLPRLVGPGRAADVLYTARRVGGEEAERIGLADRFVSSGSAVDAAVSLARDIAAGAPAAVRSTRSTLRDGVAEEARTAMAHELAEQSRLAGTADAREGVTAMLERREPRFSHGS